MSKGLIGQGPPLLDDTRCQVAGPSKEELGCGCRRGDLHREDVALPAVFKAYTEGDIFLSRASKAPDIRE